jgi:hypothetical protein
VALHEIPDDGARHDRAEVCPCRPRRGEGVHRITAGPARGFYQGVKYTHQRMSLSRPGPDPFAATAASDDYDDTFGGAQ